MRSLVRSIPRRLLFGALLLLPAALALGCSGGKGTVSGEVKYDGQPLPSGTITFLAQSGHKQVAGADVVDGKYTVTNLESGPYKVIVQTVQPGRGGQPPTGQAIQATGSSAPVGKFVPIPKKYSMPEQSGLSHDVKSGQQTKDFDLSSR